MKRKEETTHTSSDYISSVSTITKKVKNSSALAKSESIESISKQILESRQNFNLLTTLIKKCEVILY